VSMAVDVLGSALRVSGAWTPSGSQADLLAEVGVLAGRVRQDRKIEKACAAFGLRNKGVGVVFKAGFPAWGRRGAAGSFLRRALAA
jgi:hypothetical protein